MTYNLKTQHLICPVCGFPRISYSGGQVCQCSNIVRNDNPDDEVTTISTDLH